MKEKLEKMKKESEFLNKTNTLLENMNNFSCSKFDNI